MSPAVVLDALKRAAASVEARLRAATPLVSAVSVSRPAPSGEREIMVRGVGVGWDWSDGIGVSGWDWSE